MYGREQDDAAAHVDQEHGELDGMMRENFPAPRGASRSLSRHSENRTLAMSTDIVPERDSYPQCIVWTPIHGCTWCFPFIGHMGIGLSNGEVWEFMGFGATRAPEGGLSFGPVCRYIQLGSSGVKKVHAPRNAKEEAMT